MGSLEVGKPYQEGLKRIPEGIILDFNQGGGFLRIVFDSPLDNEIKEIKEGKIKLGLLEEAGIIFFFIKCGELPWMDTPYNVEFSQPFELEELTDEKKGYPFQIVLVDGMTGIVRALNLIGLPHEMSKHLKEMIEKQRAAPIKNYDIVLHRIYSKYETEALLEEVEIYLL
jgi:hypothetical protein